MFRYVLDSKYASARRVVLYFEKHHEDTFVQEISFHARLLCAHQDCFLHKPDWAGALAIAELLFCLITKDTISLFGISASIWQCLLSLSSCLCLRCPLLWPHPSKLSCLTGIVGGLIYFLWPSLLRDQLCLVQNPYAMYLLHTPLQGSNLAGVQAEFYSVSDPSVTCCNHMPSFSSQPLEQNLCETSGVSSVVNILRIGRGSPAMPGHICVKWGWLSGMWTAPPLTRSEKSWSDGLNLGPVPLAPQHRVRTPLPHLFLEALWNHAVQGKVVCLPSIKRHRSKGVLWGSLLPLPLPQLLEKFSLGFPLPLCTRNWSKTICEWKSSGKWCPGDFTTSHICQTDLGHHERRCLRSISVSVSSEIFVHQV